MRFEANRIIAGHWDWKVKKRMKNERNLKENKRFYRRNSSLTLAEEHNTTKSPLALPSLPSILFVILPSYFPESPSQFLYPFRLFNSYKKNYSYFFFSSMTMVPKYLITDFYLKKFDCWSLRKYISILF